MKAVLCSLLLSSAVAGLARADAPSEAELRASIERAFVRPLAERARTRSHFSRAMVPPFEYRVGTVSPALQHDARGQAFATFTVDARFAGARDWHRAELTGCLYPADGAIYLQRADGWSPASLLLGRRSPKAPDGVCRAATVAAK